MTNCFAHLNQSQFRISLLHNKNVEPSHSVCKQTALVVNIFQFPLINGPT